MTYDHNKQKVVMSKKNLNYDPLRALVRRTKTPLLFYGSFGAKTEDPDTTLSLSVVWLFGAKKH